jgi:hypothetical protein
MDLHATNTNDQGHDEVESVTQAVDPIRDTDDQPIINDPVSDRQLVTDQPSPPSAIAINAITGPNRAPFPTI